MNTINFFFRGLKIVHFLIISILFLSFQSCRTDNKHKNNEQAKLKKDNVIEIITEAMDFQTVNEILSGWHTFRYINKSDEAHFFLLNKYPEGKTIKDGEHEVSTVFQKGMDLINEGKSEEGFLEFNKLPAWFFEVVYSGGSGLVSPGQTSETTIKLDPGYYVIECYVKMANGKFHSAMGMVKELVITKNSTPNFELTPDIKISISSTEGIVYNDTISKGKQIFSVHFKDQIAHENFVGHDVNLVKLSENANLEALEKWMNWADPKGLITPVPEGITFLGGVNDMSAGSTGYFTVTLESGNYAMIAEVPNSLSKNMLKTFVVSE
jgi:uncharacterized membrane protein YwzB